MLVHIRQPYFSIINAAIFGLLGLAFSLSAHFEIQVVLNGLPAVSPQMVLSGAVISPAMGFVIAGVFFVMAYFSLVHLKYKG
jgi:phosphate/sulfate permease